jgi:S-phase kinase-associated protein 1
MSELVQSYYANFVDSLSHDELAQMARAANFMGVGPLLHLCAAKIASYIRNKSPAEIRTGLGLSMNFSAEQAEKIAKENEWAKDLTDRK